MIQQLLLDATLETLYMVFAGTAIAVLIGTPMGLVLYVCAKDSVAENPALYRILDVIVNIVRSIPYVIFMFLVLPLSQILLGTTIGPTATLVSLSLSAAPFFARTLEQALNDVDSGVVEAALAMGSTNRDLVFKVLLPEAMPAIISAVTLLLINLVGFTAMAGTLGAGGLGAVAVRYGYYRRETTILLASVVIIIVLVQAFQILGMGLSRKVNKK